MELQIKMWIPLVQVPARHFADSQTTCLNNYVLPKSSIWAASRPTREWIILTGFICMGKFLPSHWNYKWQQFHLYTVVSWRNKALTQNTTGAVQVSMNSREHKNGTDLREKFWWSMMFSFCFIIKEPGRIFLVKTSKIHVKWFLNYKTPLSKVHSGS